MLPVQVLLGSWQNEIKGHPKPGNGLLFGVDAVGDIKLYEAPFDLQAEGRLIEQSVSRCRGSFVLVSSSCMLSMFDKREVVVHETLAARADPTNLLSQGGCHFSGCATFWSGCSSYLDGGNLQLRTRNGIRSRGREFIFAVPSQDSVTSKAMQYQ